MAIILSVASEEQLRRTIRNVDLGIIRDGNKAANEIEHTRDPERIRKVLQQLDITTREREIVGARARGELGGFESLVTNDKGSRSTQWFTESGLAFSGGLARPCVAIVICHRDIGMAAAHRDTITLECQLQAILRGRVDRAYERRLNIVSPLERERTISSEQSRQEMVTQTLQEAAEEFHALAEDMPPEGIITAVCGMQYLRSWETGPYIDLVHRLIQEKFANSEITRPENYLGKRGQLLYGGRSHPRYSSLTFVEGENLIVRNSLLRENFSYRV